MWYKWIITKKKIFISFLFFLAKMSWGGEFHTVLATISASAMESLLVNEICFSPCVFSLYSELEQCCVTQSFAWWGGGWGHHSAAVQHHRTHFCKFRKDRVDCILYWSHTQNWTDFNGHNIHDVEWHLFSAFCPPSSEEQWAAVGSTSRSSLMVHWIKSLTIRSRIIDLLFIKSRLGVTPLSVFLIKYLLSLNPQHHIIFFKNKSMFFTFILKCDTPRIADKNGTLL